MSTLSATQQTGGPVESTMLELIVKHEEALRPVLDQLDPGEVFVIHRPRCRALRGKKPRCTCLPVFVSAPARC